MANTRSRAFPPLSGDYRLRTYKVSNATGAITLPSDTGVLPYVFPTKLKGTQVTVSENHPRWFRRKNVGSGVDIGGPFQTARKQVTSNTGFASVHSSLPVSGSVNHAIYRGIVLPIDPSLASVSFPTVVGSSDALLHALGTKAIAIVKPTNSIADVSTFLGETLREGIPKMIGSALWKSKTAAAKLLSKQGSREYLNLEFGWKPFLADITDIINAVRRAGAVLQQYERDAGKVVRRRYEFPAEPSVSETVVASDVRVYLPRYQSPTMDSGPSQGKVVREDYIFQRRWFSGAFTYHLPVDYNSRNKMVRYAARAEKLFGVAITPEVLWNLAPWSWAADWFANTGDVISNLTDWSTDGLVLRWGYMMEHTLHRRTYTYIGPSGFAGVPVPPPLVLTVEVKKRVKATPFGFGLTWESFTARQVAILTALGITRSG